MIPLWVQKIINEIFKPQIYILLVVLFYNEFTSYGFGWFQPQKKDIR
jgi:hypothetical protein